jgi:hypothetical protein
MLFQARFHDRIRSGEIRCSVRIWQRPHVKVGGRYALWSGGAVVVDKIHEGRIDDLTPALARRCGFESLADALKTAKHGAGERVFIIDFHYDGDARRRAPKTEAVGAAELAELAQRLDAMDRRSRSAPWTRATLRAIAARPAVLAAKLASSLGRPRDEFKRDVRKLKNLGLTFSLEVGYRLTPKGEALLAAIERQPSLERASG